MINLGPVGVDENKLAEICRRYGVRELSLFGSAARGEVRPDSDIDWLVEFLPEAEPGLLDHAGLMLDLSELLGRKVDLVSKNALKPLIRDSIIQDSRRLYAACGVVPRDNDSARNLGSMTRVSVPPALYS